ncbi:hypothetical protein ANCDUO_10143 [Ancylostoma duodenale]|uniref:CUB domain-containing protein n=1 Tax=Ancylostoma duodenale TaxID=51022 RepID=A0A0C2DB38_9BILA|nr:hypothetical protein ANCDUO_10143 [Ancylostoma duodenale]
MVDIPILEIVPDVFALLAMVPPDGCGKELEAKETWQTQEITVGENSQLHLDGYKKCNYWIKFPKDKKIRIELKEIQFNSTAGCTKGGLEIKTNPDETLTGYRFCEELDEGQTVVSTSSPVPLIIYSRLNSRSRAVIRFKYVTHRKTSGDGHDDTD